ncbi:MAG: hypothetical protein R2793_02525 [Flavobacteriaceae bacterium]
MNFNYSYRAFLISSLLVGNLILLLVSVKLGGKAPEKEETLPVEYAEILPEEQEIALSTTTEKEAVETNKAYNEAEKFISDIENSREEEAQEVTTEGETYNMEASGGTIDFSKAQDQLDKAKETLEEAAKKKSKKSKSANRRTTNYYSLVGRDDLYLPNPVYTCDAGGKIVITIEVNELGKVVKTSYNATLSTTTNGCLIDAALAYAAEARFTTLATKPKQLGTITYLFPGQE